MTPEQFVYWLQGYAELTRGQGVPTAGQWQSIVEHLATVFNKQTPPLDSPRLDNLLDLARRYNPGGIPGKTVC